MTKAQAYRAFTNRKLRQNESRDAYVTDLQRLTEFAGHKSTEDKDPMLVKQIIAGLPMTYSSERQISMSLRGCMVDSCLELMKVLRVASTEVQALSNLVESIVAVTNATNNRRFHMHVTATLATGHMK